MSHISAAEYIDLHDDGQPERDNGHLYCHLCFLPFVPEGPDPVSQKDDDCLCGPCADAIAEMCAGRVA